MTRTLTFLLALALAGCGAAPPPGAIVARVSCQAETPCPYQAPYCVAGACEPCSADSSLCQGETPFCLGAEAGEDAGRCGACRTHMDCGVTGYCWHARCLPPCKKSSECPSKACVRSDDDERGGCAPPEETILVDDTQAFQSVLFQVSASEKARAEAVAQYAPTLPPPVRVVRLLPNERVYPTGVILSSVTIVGDDDPTTTKIGGDRQRDGIRIDYLTNPSDVRLQRLTIWRTDGGIVCRGSARLARVSLVRVQVVSTLGMALDLAGCDLTMERSAVQDSFGGALSIVAPATFAIENSIFADSSNKNGPMLSFGGADGTVRFSSIINNLSSVRRVMSCGWGAVSLEQTLILRSQPPKLPPDEQDPLVGPCTLADVVIDVPSQNPGALLGSPDLVDPRPFGDFGNYRPVQSPKTLSCCLRTTTPGPSHDFVGTPRSYPLATIGAYEVVR